MNCSVVEDLIEPVEDCTSIESADERTREITAVDQAAADAKFKQKLRELSVYAPDDLRRSAREQSLQPELVKGLLRSCSVNILVGDSGLGKTPLGLQLGVCVAGGLPFFGHEIVRKGPVLYCDAETERQSFIDILDAISRFLDLPEPPSEFYVWSPNWELEISSSESGASWDKKLITRVHEVTPRLVIIDPLRMFWPKVESKNEDAADMIRSLRDASRSMGCSWLITHHRRKASQLAELPDLSTNPNMWFQEAAGSHALINQSDTRLGVAPHTGQADLLLGGFMRGSGPLVPLDLARATDDDGTPVGYRLLTGPELLSENDGAVFDRLPVRFRFKDVGSVMPGNSASNVTRLLGRCQQLGLVRKDGSEYVKTAANGGAHGVDGVKKEPAPSTPPTPPLADIPAG